MKYLDRVVLLVICGLLMLLFTACNYSENEIISFEQRKINDTVHNDVIVGAQRIAIYHPILANKKIGVVVNQTSTVDGQHLVDTLLSLGVQIVNIFAPEHGFRGEADAGQKIKDGIDAKTNLPIISLYGKNKKPTPEQMEGLEVVVFDIQDVGARFYTYISTLHYMMEACAEAGIPLVVLDRPNPNAHYIDGPVMEDEYRSFVGMHPVPIVYGMTIGEYAQMINGESWLAGGKKADLTVVSCKNYTHDTFYELPVKPSPNLPNIRSILLYPSLCLFEGTTVSVGRGTDKQFQLYGHPELNIGNCNFMPTSRSGAKYPKHEAVKCNGYTLEHSTLGSLFDKKEIDLEHLRLVYTQLNNKNVKFFNDNNFFEKLAGTASLRNDILNNKPISDIKASWQEGLEKFKITRGKYLLYP